MHAFLSIDREEGVARMHTFLSINRERSKYKDPQIKTGQAKAPKTIKQISQ
jgi:hypothetical protein